MAARLSQAADAAAASTIVYTCPSVQAHGHAVRFLGCVFGGKTLALQETKQAFLCCRLIPPGRAIYCQSRAGKLNVVGVCFFNMHAMTCNFSGLFSQIPRPHCLEINPLTVLHQRLKALRDARHGHPVLAAGPNTSQVAFFRVERHYF